MKDVSPKETHYQTITYYPKTNQPQNEFLPQLQHVKDAYTLQSNQPSLIEVKKQDITQKLLQPLTKNVNYIDKKNPNLKQTNDKILRSIWTLSSLFNQ